jgi:hypothetical protein
MDDTRLADLEALRHLKRQVWVLSDAIRVRFEPAAHRLARQRHHDAGWLGDELRACRVAPDSGTLATVRSALAAVLGGE